jgi:glycosyltransferase involved in cell wall biosynthesis
VKLLLVMASSPYPPTSGARIRQWQELRYLARRHDVTAVFFSGPAGGDVPSPLRRICRAVAVPHPRRLGPDDLVLSRSAPWSLRWYGTAGMARALRDIGPRTFDAVIVDSLYMTLYPDLYVPRAILQEHNIESQLAKQFIEPRRDAPARGRDGHGPAFWRAVAAQMEAHENRTWPAFRLRVAVSHADKAVMDQRCAPGRTIVLENGADTGAPPVRDRLGPPAVLFAGALDYYPNVDAAHYMAKAIMPAVWAREPEIRLIIAGRQPDPTLSELAGPRVHLVANPEDMRTVAAQASVSVVPLRLGAGTRLKILESLAWGLPVVSTRLGCAGLALRDGEHLLVRDEPDAFAEATVHLLSDAGRWHGLSVAGRAAVEAQYGWESLLEKFEAELWGFVNGAAPAEPASLGTIGVAAATSCRSP